MVNNISQKITGELKLSPTILNIAQKVENVSGLGKEIKASLGKEITEIATIILGGAINLDASDIHVEPKEEGAEIRARIDGILQNVITIDSKVYQGLLTRVKLLSGIKLNITDRPQDGRFSVLMPETTIEIRVSTLPAEYGESLVLRILNPKTLVGLEALGLRKDLLELFKAEIRRPTGMIIVTGPTGSGKTTTLYAFLRKVQKPEIKVITIEDPIEYHLGGISQTQVNPKKGYDFASGLQSIMRQDPDVILVGEIRDLKTAEIALQAALTGHLVFTTLHTNDAAGTVARLTSLGAKASNIGPAINIAVAQRLVRRICKKCGKAEKVSALNLKKIKKALEGLSSLSTKRGVKTLNLTKDLKVPQTKGCKCCSFTGYRGRTGIFEAFIVDDEMERLILKAPSIAALRAIAIKKGMVTMQQDGLIKVLEGITTIEEVERITGPIKK